MRPPDLGRDQRRLLRAATVAGGAEGLAATALPLLAAGLTRDPLAVAGVVVAQHLPWALTALIGPASVGSSDGRTVLGLVDSVRAMAAGVLGLLALTGSETILVLQATAFVIGLGEALTDLVEADATDVVAVPGQVDGAEGTAVGGMVGAVVGLAAGGLLYELVSALPLLMDVPAFALAALLALSLRRPVARRGAARPSTGPGSTAGRRAVMGVAALGTAATGAVLGVLVLFALDDLGLGAPAFGLLLAGLAVSTALGGLVAPELGRLVGVRGGLVGAMAVTGSAHLAAALLADPVRPALSVVALGAAAGAAMAAGVLA
ncbi:MAG: hypothetical protein ACRDZ9_10255, partial [Acidimicrobiales bacterium]